MCSLLLMCNFSIVLTPHCCIMGVFFIITIIDASASLNKLQDMGRNFLYAQWYLFCFIFAITIFEAMIPHETHSCSLLGRAHVEVFKYN